VFNCISTNNDNSGQNQFTDVNANSLFSIYKKSSSNPTATSYSQSLPNATNSNVNNNRGDNSTVSCVNNRSLTFNYPQGNPDLSWRSVASSILGETNNNNEESIPMLHHATVTICGNTLLLKGPSKQLLVVSNFTSTSINTED
jgi:hypothetical protein